MKYKIETEECVKCGICQKECPTKAIKAHKKTDDLVIIDKNCIHCGHCGAVCPQDAITCSGDKLEPVGPVNLDEADVFNLIAGKRSVRRYEEKAIPQDIIDRILKVGTLTSTATNSQDVKVSLFRGDEVKLLSSTLSGQLLKLIKLINNPIGRLYAVLSGNRSYASKKRLKSFEEYLDKGVRGQADPLFFDAPLVVNVTFPKKNKRFGRTNAVLAGQSMMLYAHSLGIESCMIGFAEVAGKKKAGRIALKTDRGRATGLIFTLGYGKPKYHRLPKRKSLLA